MRMKMYPEVPEHIDALLVDTPGPRYHIAQLLVQVAAIPTSKEGVAWTVIGMAGTMSPIPQPKLDSTTTTRAKKMTDDGLVQRMVTEVEEVHPGVPRRQRKSCVSRGRCG